MQDIDLFQLALALTPPWQVSSTEFNLAEKRLDIRLDFPKGSAFACPKCGTPAKAYDTTEKTWRHLNFFQYNAYLTARVPRVSCQTAVSIRYMFPGHGTTADSPCCSKP